MAMANHQPQPLHFFFSVIDQYYKLIFLSTQIYSLGHNYLNSDTVFFVIFPLYTIKISALIEGGFTKGAF